jgi:serine phosphatase RsbU (regulator of sigma subunit)
MIQIAYLSNRQIVIQGIMKSLKIITPFLILMSLAQFQGVAQVNTNEPLSKVMSLIAKSSSAMHGDYDSSLNLALEANKIALNANDMLGQMHAQHQIGFIFYNRNNFDLALHHFRISLDIAQKINNSNGEALALNRIGNVLHLKTNHIQSIEYYTKALAINTQIDNKSEIARTLVNLANAYSAVGQYQRSIEHFLKAMDMQEKTNDKEGMAWASLGTARLFKLLGLYDKSMQYIETALSLYREIEQKTGKSTGVTLCLNELGGIYQKMGNYERALEYVRMVLEINIRNKNLYGQASNYMSLGVIFLEKNQNNLAGENLQRALVLKDLVGDSIDLAALNRYLAEVEFRKNNFPKAISHLHKSLEFANRNQQLPELNQTYLILSKVYGKQGNYKQALEAHIKHGEYKDSINASEISKLEMQYEFDKREQEQELIAQQRETFHQLQMERQRVVLIFFIVAFLLAGGLAASVFYAYREKKRVNKVLVNQNNEITRQNKEIEQQKEEIEQQRDFVTKQRDQIADQQRLITDSIMYASRIQNAVLPTRRILEELPWNTFILYKPKNIVSGDFYWSSKLTDGRILIAVGDCTGHGVPGAFMSMLGITLLREIVAHEKDLSPTTILSKLRDMVIDSLNQRTGQIEQSDGMDMAIGIIDPISLEMEYAGAYNSIIVIRNGEFKPNDNLPKSRTSKHGELSILEIRGDKMPVGHYAIEKQPFTNSSLTLIKGDSLYFFTDGYIDQFGGANNTKFLLPTFKDLIASIQNLEMQLQSEILSKTIDEYKGDQKQVDDMLVLGLKIS